jgi:hypothetical protein
MRRRRTLALIAAAVLAAVAVAATASAGNTNTLTLAVFGDSPYFEKGFAPNAEYLATPAFIDTINSDPSVQDVIHVGDIHSGSEACRAREHVPARVAEAHDRPAGGVGERGDPDLVGPLQLGTRDAAPADAVVEGAKRAGLRGLVRPSPRVQVRGGEGGYTEPSSPLSSAGRAPPW